jgi:hypothetical protein
MNGWAAKNRIEAAITQTNATPYAAVKIAYVEIFLKLVRNEDKTSSPSVVMITSSN